MPAASTKAGRMDHVSCPWGLTCRNKPGASRDRGRGREVGQVASVVCILQKHFHDVLEVTGCPEVVERKRSREQVAASERTRCGPVKDFLQRDKATKGAAGSRGPAVEGRADEMERRPAGGGPAGPGGQDSEASRTLHKLLFGRQGGWRPRSPQKLLKRGERVGRERLLSQSRTLNDLLKASGRPRNGRRGGCEIQRLENRAWRPSTCR